MTRAAGPSSFFSRAISLGMLMRAMIGGRDHSLPSIRDFTHSEAIRIPPCSDPSEDLPAAGWVMPY